MNKLAIGAILGIALLIPAMFMAFSFAPATGTAGAHATLNGVYQEDNTCYVFIHNNEGQKNRNQDAIGGWGTTMGVKIGVHDVEMDGSAACNLCESALESFDFIDYSNSIGLYDDLPCGDA